MNLITKTNTKIGELVSWLNPILIGLIMIDLILRYIFRFTKIWIVELEWHLYSTIFLLSGAFALIKEKHVRVDIIYQSASSRTKDLIDIIGTLVLLIPWTAIVAISSYKYTFRSFEILESSPDPAGLAYRFIIKGIIFISFTMLFLQGVVIIVDKFNALRKT